MGEPGLVAGPGLLRRAALRGFAVRVVILGASGRLAFDERQWQDSLVEVEAGDLDIQFRGGRSLHCGAGTLLSFAGLPIRALHNPGCDCTSLVAVSRRPPPVTGRPTSRRPNVSPGEMR
jgi:hypothetical protein